MVTQAVYLAFKAGTSVELPPRRARKAGAGAAAAAAAPGGGAGQGRKRRKVGAAADQDQQSAGCGGEEGAGSQQPVAAAGRHRSTKRPHAASGGGQGDTAQGAGPSNSFATSTSSRLAVLLADAPPFVAAAAFAGPKPGYVFKGGQGRKLGYYKDAASCRTAPRSASTAGKGSRKMNR